MRSSSMARGCCFERIWFAVLAPVGLGDLVELQGPDPRLGWRDTGERGLTGLRGVVVGSDQWSFTVLLASGNELRCNRDYVYLVQKGDEAHTEREDSNG
jgi:hypothetical protein